MGNLSSRLSPFEIRMLYRLLSEIKDRTYVKRTQLSVQDVTCFAFKFFNKESKEQLNISKKCQKYRYKSFLNVISYLQELMKEMTVSKTGSMQILSPHEACMLYRMIQNIDRFTKINRIHLTIQDFKLIAFNFYEIESIEWGKKFNMSDDCHAFRLKSFLNILDYCINIIKKM